MTVSKLCAVSFRRGLCEEKSPPVRFVEGFGVGGFRWVMWGGFLWKIRESGKEWGEWGVGWEPLS